MILISTFLVTSEVEYLLKISEIENPSLAFAFRERKCDMEVGVDIEDFKFIHIALFLKNMT